MSHLNFHFSPQHEEHSGPPSPHEQNQESPTVSRRHPCNFSSPQHGWLIVFVHSFGQSRLRCDQLQRKFPCFGWRGVVHCSLACLASRLPRSDGDHGSTWEKMKLKWYWYGHLSLLRQVESPCHCWQRRGATGSGPWLPCRIHHGHARRRCGGRCCPVELFQAARLGHEGQVFQHCRVTRCRGIKQPAVHHRCPFP